jgi:DNA-binding IclR family transcriptional regulator
MTKDDHNKTRVIQSVQRALDIIDCFDTQAIELTLNEISMLLNLNKSTVHGILSTLVVNDYISQNNSNGKYYLGRRLITKGFLASNSLQYDLKEIGTKYLRMISEKYKVTSHLFTYRNGTLVFLEMAVPKSAYYIVSSVIGRNMPLHATASGKLVLSFMDQIELEFWVQNNDLLSFTEKTISTPSDFFKQIENIKLNGYSTEDEEVEIGLYSIALPICKPDNSLFGTISITGNSIKVKSDVENITTDLMSVREKIENELFHSVYAQ